MSVATSTRQDQGLEEAVEQDPQRRVFVGVDTHQRTHHAAVIDQDGRWLGDREFAATRVGMAAGHLGGRPRPAGGGGSGIRPAPMAPG